MISVSKNSLAKNSAADSIMRVVVISTTAQVPLPVDPNFQGKRGVGRSFNELIIRDCRRISRYSDPSVNIDFERDTKEKLWKD